MTTPSPITTPRPPPAANLASAAGGANLGRDEFLQLLVAQLRNQDPTSPQGGHEFVAQLAQFSSVEQLTHISGSLSAQSGQLAALSERLDGLRAGQTDLSGQLSGRIDLQAATGLIGRTVDAGSPDVSLGESGDAPVQVRLGGAAREVELVVRDASGKAVRTIRTASLGAGDHTLAWDGATDDGARAPAGRYTASVTALGSDGKSVEATPFVSGTVERVTVENGRALIWVGGRPIPFEDLVGVHPDAPSAAGPASGAASPSTNGFLPL